MRKIRIGKDIEVRWRILTNGEPLPLAGRDLWLEIVNGYGRQGHEFSIEDGNEVVFTFGGLEQRHPGVHTFTLWENRGKAGQTVVDSCDGVELVRSTCMEGGDGGNVSSETSDLSTESINLSSVNLGTETDSYTKEEVDTKFQAKTDPALETESKTVVGAINEVHGAVETLQESSTPTYVLNGLYMALSMGGLHLDDATPYIGSFEELAAAVKNKARIVDYTFAERGTSGDQTMVISVGNANLIEGKTINIVFDLGQGFCEVLITKTDDGCSATGKLIPLAATNVKVTLSSAYTIPANPSDTEYVYYITVGTATYPVTGAEGIVWQDGTPPEVESNSTLVVSVINNLAVWGTFKEGES